MQRGGSDERGFQMNHLRQRGYIFALLALLFVFGACKGESPTAPPITPPGTGTGNPPGTPPGAGSSVTLTVANPNPLTDSSTAITATVLINGQPAPAGTAIEFETTLGRFEESGASETLRTTNAQGQVTVNLTSSSAGTATVTAVVNNIVQRTTVNFTARPVTPQPPDTGSTITSVTPSFGPVEGGTLVTINGTNFRQPVRVFFDLGGGELREATVASVTPTRIEVIAPRVQLATGQTLESTVVVFVEAGTPNEQRVTSAATFTFRSSQLTPAVSAVSPPSGPLEGGTRVSILGDGFEPFVQVFFGLAEAEIVNVTFNEIVAIAPNSRDTTVDAAPVAGQVPIRIVNVNSRTETTFTAGFRYHSAVRIIAVGPTAGPFTGGTRVRIDGVGFDDPVAVTIGGFAAQPIQVSGTQIIAITSAIPVTDCNDVTGDIAVTNINTGASAVAEDLEFTYQVPQPIVVSVSNPTQVGGSISIRVFNAFGFPRLRLGDTSLSVTGQTDNGDGTTTFTAIVPTTIQLETEACAGVTGIQALRPTAFDVTYESATTGCTDTATRGATIEPPNTPLLRFSPATYTPFTAAITPASAGPPIVPASVTPSQAQTLNVVNAGRAPLEVQSISATTAGCAFFTISAPPTPQTLQTCEVAPITARYNGSTTPGTQSCTLTVVTDAGTRSFTLTGTSQ